MSQIDAFLKHRDIAVIGISREKGKFGNSAASMLVDKGYRVHLVHPIMKTFEGLTVVSSVEQLAPEVKACLLVVPPTETEKLIPTLAAQGIENVWLQQGAESDTARALCDQHRINCISGECIFMFAEPVSGIHKWHRWIWRLLGKLPN